MNAKAVAARVATHGATVSIEAADLIAYSQAEFDAKTVALDLDATDSQIVFQGRAEAWSVGTKTSSVGAALRGERSSLHLAPGSVLNVWGIPDVGSEAVAGGVVGIDARGNDLRITNDGDIALTSMFELYSYSFGVRGNGQRVLIVNGEDGHVTVDASTGLQGAAAGVVVQDQTAPGEGGSRVTNAGHIIVNAAGAEAMPSGWALATGVDAEGRAAWVDNAAGGVISATASGATASYSIGVSQSGDRHELTNAGTVRAEVRSGAVASAAGALAGAAEYRAHNAATGRIEVLGDGALVTLAAGFWLTGPSNDVDNAGEVAVTAKGGLGAAAGGVVAVPQSGAGADARVTVRNHSGGVIRVDAEGPWALAGGVLSPAGLLEAENQGAMAVEAKGRNTAIALGMLTPARPSSDPAVHSIAHNHGVVSVHAASLDEDGRGTGPAVAAGTWLLGAADEAVNAAGAAFQVMAEGYAASAAGFLGTGEGQLIANASEMSITARASTYAAATGMGAVGSRNELYNGEDIPGRHGPPSADADGTIVLAVTASAPAANATGFVAAGAGSRVINAGTVSVVANAVEWPQAATGGSASPSAPPAFAGLPTLGEAPDELHEVDDIHLGDPVSPWTQALESLLSGVPGLPPSAVPGGNTALALGANVVVPRTPADELGTGLPAVLVDNRGTLTVRAENLREEATATAFGVRVEFQGDGEGPAVIIENNDRLDVQARGTAETRTVGIGVYGGSAYVVNRGFLSVNAHGLDSGTFRWSRGIHVTGGTSDDRVEIINEGLILAGTAPAYNFDSAAVDAQEFSGSVVVDNHGTVIGDIRLTDSGHDRFVARAGSYAGAVHLGGGDDVAVIESGARVSLLEAGAGDQDLLVLVDTGNHGTTVIEARDFETTRIDSGSWSFTGHSSLGATEMYGGEIHLETGSVVNVESLSVAAGAVLSGYGVVEGPVTNAGILSPGGSIGTLTVRGDYHQSGVYRADISAEADNGVGKSDRLVVQGGQAVFAPGAVLHLVPAPGVYGPVTTYVLVEGDVILPEDGLVVQGPLFLNAQVETGSLLLTITPKPFTGAAVTGNQTAVAEVLTAALDHPDSALDDVQAWLFSLSEEEAASAQALFDALSGEVYTVVPTVAAWRLDGQVGAVRQGITAPQQWLSDGLWLTVGGGAGRINATADTAAAEISSDPHRLTVGSTLWRGDGFAGGLTAGVGTATVRMPDRASQWQGTDWQLGAYVEGRMGSVHLLGVVGVQRGTYTSDRTIIYAGGEHVARGSFTTTDAVVAATARFQPFALGPVGLTPVVSAGWYHTSRPGFAETRGAGPLALELDSYSASWLRGRIGVELGPPGGQADNVAGGSAEDGARRVQPYAHLAWRVDMQAPQRQIQARFVGDPDLPFPVTGTPWAASAVEAAAGLVVQASAAWSWGVHYQGEFSDDGAHHRITAGVRWGF